MLLATDTHRADQTGIDTGQIGARRDRLLGHFQEVEYLAYSQPVAPSTNLDQDNRTLILRSALLLQEDVTIQNGEEGSPDVDQAFDRLGHTRDPGSRKARQDLPHDPCRGRANQRTDSKDDGV
jgi:hypothetical protein